MFEMFMGPLEDAKPWNTKGIVGIKRFLENVYKLKDKKLYDCQGNNCKMKESGLPQMLHKTIKKVTEDIEKLRFNTAISQMMIFVKFASKFNEIPHGALENFLKLLAPFAPHLAEELWEKLGNKESIFKQKWPEYDPAIIQDEEIELVIQVCGKVRDRIKVSTGITEKEATELAKQSQKIKNFIGAKPIKKVIFVKNRLINIVI
jgi:leucyl-tRNA synthetase